MKTFLNWLMPNEKYYLTVTLKSGAEFSGKVANSKDGSYEDLCMAIDMIDKAFKNADIVGHVRMSGHAFNLQEIAHYHLKAKRGF